MKIRKAKKGFTIIELVIVIAVIGILAAILVPTFINLNNKASEASNQSFVKDLNTQMAMREVNEGKNATMNDAIIDAREIGYDVEKLTPVNNRRIVWDSVDNKFALLNEDGTVYLANGGNELKATKAEDVWEIVKSDDEFTLYNNEPSANKNHGHSIYLAYVPEGTDEDHKWSIGGLKVGLDVGSQENIGSVTYDRSTATNEKSVVIRTNTLTTKLTVNAPHDTVDHHGFSYYVDAKATKSSSYHEHGTVGRLKLSSGHAVVENNGTVYCAIDNDGNELGATITTNGGTISARESGEGSPNTSTKDEHGICSSFSDCGYGFHNLEELVVDATHAYNVCSACGYIVVVAGVDGEGQPVYHTSTNEAATANADSPSYIVNEELAFGVVTSNVDIPAAHTHSFVESEIESANCNAEGLMNHVCSCGMSFTSVIAKNDAHIWRAPTYTWNEDNTKLTATRVCNRNTNHVETETVDVTSEVTKAATCTATGDTTYTSNAFINPAFSAQSKTVTGNVPALGHDWGDWTVTTQPTCEGAGIETRVCQHDPSHTETQPVDALGHDWSAWASISDTQHQRVCHRDPNHTETANHSFDDNGVCTACHYAQATPISTFEELTAALNASGNYRLTKSITVTSCIYSRGGTAESPLEINIDLGGFKIQSDEKVDYHVSLIDLQNTNLTIKNGSVINNYTPNEYDTLYGIVGGNCSLTAENISFSGTVMNRIGVINGTVRIRNIDSQFNGGYISAASTTVILDGVGDYKISSPGYSFMGWIMAPTIQAAQGYYITSTSASSALVECPEDDMELYRVYEVRVAE